MPQGLTRWGSWMAATPGRSETRLVCKTLPDNRLRSSRGSRRGRTRDRAGGRLPVRRDMIGLRNERQSARRVVRASRNWPGHKARGLLRTAEGVNEEFRMRVRVAAAGGRGKWVEGVRRARGHVMLGQGMRGLAVGE